MPSRAVRRARRKRLARIAAQPLREKARLAAWMLVSWRAEARRRARSLGDPAVWALADDPHIREAVEGLDPTGGLQADLNLVCAEAVAEVAGLNLIQGSRPSADRSRREPAERR